MKAFRTNLLCFNLVSVQVFKNVYFNSGSSVPAMGRLNFFLPVDELHNVLKPLILETLRFTLDAVIEKTCNNNFSFFVVFCCPFIG